MINLKKIRDHCFAVNYTERRYCSGDEITQSIKRGNVMETHVCRKCGHIAFDNAPVDCPVCKAAIEHFDNNPEAIKKPLDPDNLNEMEKKHIPVVTLTKECCLIPGSGCVDVQVKVGEIEHVMESEHYINFIDYYIDKRYLARVQLTYKRLHPADALCLNVDGGTLAVIENCNVHGSWMTEVNLNK
jgi:superoxide reductase